MLDGMVQFNITAEDEDTVKFEVINKPESATAIQSGNVLYFYWNVTSSEKVHNFKQQSTRPSIICYTTVLCVVTRRSSGEDSCVTTLCAAETKARVKVCEVLWFIVSLSILIGCFYFGEPVT